MRGKGAGGEGGKVGLQQGEHVRQLPSAEPMNLHGLSQDTLVVEQLLWVELGGVDGQLAHTGSLGVVEEVAADELLGAQFQNQLPFHVQVTGLPGEGVLEGGDEEVLCIGGGGASLFHAAERLQGGGVVALLAVQLLMALRAPGPAPVHAAPGNSPGRPDPVPSALS